MKSMKQFLLDIKEFIYIWYITNPILNPTVIKIQPITKLTKFKNKVTKYRLITRKHLLDPWKVVGDFKSFKSAMEAAIK